MACQTPNPVAETHLQTPSASEIVNLTSSLSFSSPLRRTLSSRIDNLIEVSTLPEDAQVGESLYHFSVLIIFIDDLDLSPDLSDLSFLPEDLYQKNMFKLPEWTNALFRAHPLNSM